jgi:type III secretion system HrpB2-like protein
MEAIQAIGALDEGRALERAAAPAPNLSALAGRFSEMLAAPPPQHEAAPVGAPTQFAEFVGRQDTAYRILMKDISSASLDMPGMSPQQATLRSIQLMNHISAAHMSHNACIYFAQSAKNGVQTLMKNQ